MSLSTNTTYRVFVEKLGSSDPAEFVGDQGELFYDPSSTSLYISDGSTPGGVVVAGGGGGSQWTTTGSGIYYNAGNVAIGTNVVGSGSTTLLVDGNARITGILTIGTSSITLDPTNNTIIADAFITEPVGAAYTDPNRFWISTLGNMGTPYGSFSDPGGKRGNPERWTAAVSFDNDGNVYSHGGADSNSYAPSESKFAFTTKYSSSGSTIWSKNYLYQGPFEGISDYYTIGETMLVNKATDELYFTVGINTSNYVTTLIKADPSNGNILWQKQIGNEDTWSVKTLSDSDGNVYNIGVASYEQSEYGVLIVKFDSDGNELWKKLYSNSSNNNNYITVVDAIIDSDQNLYIFGSLYEDEISSYTGYLMKLDSSGNILWAKHSSSNVVFDEGELDSEGNLYLVCRDYFSYPYKFYIMKLDSDTNIIWQKRVQAEPNTINNTPLAYSIKIDSNDVLYAYGGQWGGAAATLYCVDSSGNLLSNKLLESIEDENSWYWDGHDLIDIHNDEIVVGGFTYHYTPSPYMSNAFTLKLPKDLSVREGYFDDYKFYNLDSLELVDDINYTFSDDTQITVGVSTVPVSSGLIVASDFNYQEYAIKVIDYYKPTLSQSQGTSEFDKVNANQLNIGRTPIRANTTSSYNGPWGDSLFVGANAGTAAIHGVNGGGYTQFFFGPGAGSRSYGNDNVFFGRDAGSCNFYGSHNNFFGFYAGSFNTIGCYNNFFGRLAGRYNSSGGGNNFIGNQAGYRNYDGYNNNFFGGNAGFYNINGCFNNFFGPGAGFCNTTGSNNNFFGLRSGNSNTTGSSNDFFGYGSGFYNTSGSSNIYLGNITGISTTASQKVVIGNGAPGPGFNIYNPAYNAYLFDSPDTTKDMQFAVGLRTDSNPSKYWLVGDENFNVGIGTITPTKKLHVGGDVKVGVNTSQGVVLTDSNGVEWRLSVNTNGTLAITAV